MRYLRSPWLRCSTRQPTRSQSVPRSLEYYFEFIAILCYNHKLHISFLYLKTKQSHSHQANPAVKRVEVLDPLLVVEVENCQKTDHDARERQCVEDGVEQLHVDTTEASANAVQKYRCREIAYYTGLKHYLYCVGRVNIYPNNVVGTRQRAVATKVWGSVRRALGQLSIWRNVSMFVRLDFG